MLYGDGNILDSRRPELEKMTKFFSSRASRHEPLDQEEEGDIAHLQSCSEELKMAWNGGVRRRPVGLGLGFDKDWGREKQQGLPAAATATYRRRMAVPRGGWAKAVEQDGEAWHGSSDVRRLKTTSIF